MSANTKKKLNARNENSKLKNKKNTCSFQKTLPQSLFLISLWCWNLFHRPVLVRCIPLTPRKTYTWATLEKHFSHSVLVVHMSPLCFLIILYNPQWWHLFLVQLASNEIAHLQYCYWQSNEELQFFGWRKQCFILETCMGFHLTSLGIRDIMDERQFGCLHEPNRAPDT